MTGKTIKNIYRISHAVKWFLLISIIAVFILSTLMYHVPSFLGYRIFYVPTESMEPEIPAGTFVSAKIIKEGDISPGIIGVYKSGKRLVIHRLVSFDGCNAVFKGDNNSFFDPIVPKELIRYKVIHVFT
ncbi:S24/S26 family peptidase [Butyrivibrio sp. AC2005]|uniref:S24/S26 family peptidase n=1 Tax=Butyrivibrio sp. AC2005 TaxID=1280672 RepID=UPI00047A7BAB|nr:S24/S26 family peptidase [Butyrivibrio sp. AC2005]